MFRRRNFAQSVAQEEDEDTLYYLFVFRGESVHPGLVVSSSLEEIKNIAQTAKDQGYRYNIQYKGESIESSLGQRRNPREPFDMGYKVGGGAMVKSQLASIEREARSLHDILVRGDRLPQWVHSKVTTALDRLQSASTYLKTKVPMMQQMRQNPLFGSQSKYIRNAPQMCAQSYMSSILMSHPMTREYAVSSAQRDGFDPIVAGIAFDNLTELGEISHVGEGKYLDTDFVS
jgi:hypothetical protein